MVIPLIGAPERSYGKTTAEAWLFWVPPKALPVVSSLSFRRIDLSAIG